MYEKTENIKIINYVFTPCYENSIIKNVVQKLSEKKSIRTGKTKRKETKTFVRRSIYQCFTEVPNLPLFLFLVEHVIVYNLLQFSVVCMDRKMVRCE